jgi:signal transduction histidine kinase
LEEVPDAVGRTAYRIIQEGLTNARKHAPGAPVLLQLTGSPASGLELELRNPVPQPAAIGKEGGEPGAVPPPGAGLGLIGLTERAGLAGGTLVHGPTPTREYRVRAWLPWAP